MNAPAPPVTDGEVLAVVWRELSARVGAVEVTTETDLWDIGMDSIASVSVMVGVETAFDIEFPDEMLTREIFSSAANIAQAVRQVVAARWEGEVLETQR